MGLLKENKREKMDPILEPIMLEPVPLEPDCVCCDSNGNVDQFCINPFWNEDELEKEKMMEDMDGDMDMKMGGKGMMMMGGMMPIIAMLAMEAVGSGLKLFRWTSATKYDGYSVVGTTNFWQIANQVSGYGNLVLSITALLLGALSEIMEDPMFMEAMGLSIKLGMAVFAVENMLRFYAYDRANAKATDAASLPSDASTAVDVQNALKLEMAMSTAHEAMTRLTLMKAKEGMKKKGKKGDRDDSESDEEDSVSSDDDDMSSDEGMTSDDGEGGSGDVDSDDIPSLFKF